jgi:YD repeat-containing protein
LQLWVFNGQLDPRSGASAQCAPEAVPLPDGKPIVVLCARIEQATEDEDGSLGFDATLTGTPQTWSYTYDALGQLLDSRDPRGNVTRHAYYSDTTDEHTFGDLQSVTNPAGHVTRYTRYDPSGRLLEQVDPNGIVTTMAYTPRGWLSTLTLHPSDGTPPQVTRYEYDGPGQLRQLTLPDGTALAYSYDAAHRLVVIEDSAGNSITYTLDAMGNRIQEETSDAAGDLALTVSRAYDTLNRLQSQTGAPQ